MKFKPKSIRIFIVGGYVVLCGLIFFSLLMWQKGVERRRLLQRYISSLTAQNIQHFLDERASDLRYVALQWKNGGPQGRKDVLQSERAIYDNHPEYQCIKLLSSDGTILGGCSNSPTGVLTGQNGFLPSERRGVFQQAEKFPGQMRLSGLVELNTGMPGVLLARTLGSTTRPPQGYVYVAFSLQTLIDLGLEKDWNRDFDVHLIFNDTSKNSPDPYILDHINVFGQDIKLKMKPKRSTWPEGSYDSPLLLLATGVFLLILMSIFAWRMQREETAVEDANQRLQDALSNSYDIFWTSVPGKGLTFLSPSFKSIFGFNEIDALGKNIEELAVPEDRHLIQEIRGRVVKGESIRHLFARFPSADGRVIWLESTIVPILDAQGRLLRSDGASRDVTENRRVEDRYRRLIETSSDLILEVDEEWRLRFVNGAIQNLLGIGPAEAVGRNFWNFVHPDSRPKIRQEVKLRLQDSSSARFEARFLHADGSERFLSFRLKKEPEGASQTTVFQAAGRDITAEKQLEGQIQQFQKMEAVGKLAGGMAHDFNNLLTVILSHAEGAFETLPGSSPARKDLTQIQKAARRAADLTRQVLTFSRRYPVEPVEMNLNVVVSEMQDFLRRLLPAGVALEVETSEDLSWVMADRGQMEQILMNLVLNAKDAMPQGGTIHVTTRNMELSEPLSQGPNYLAPGLWVVVEVRDEGKGISSEHIDHIFEPFYTTKSVGQGTGLGLSVVYGIVRAHQGGLHVETEMGHGTTVRVFLPLVQPAPVAALSADSPKSILMVEPDDFNRKVLRRLLGLMGYQVATAVNAAGALKAVETGGHPFDLLLASLQDGPQVAESLYRSLKDHLPGLKMVFLDVSPTGRGFTGNGRVLQPPYDVDRVSNTIRNALEGPDHDSA